MLRALLAAVGLAFLTSCATAPQVTPAVRAELAPTGKLRAGINFGNTLLTAKDPATGEPRGIAIDLARELGRRLGVPVEIVPFNSAGQMADAVKTGVWDVAFLGAEPQRVSEMSFTAPYPEIESTYLVPAGSTLRNVADVDRDGVRIAVANKSAYDLYLSRNIQRARLERAQGVPGAFKLFTAQSRCHGRPQAGAPDLRREAARLAQSARRALLGGRAGGRHAQGPRRRRNVLSAFLEEIKASGLLAQTIEKNGVRGLTGARPLPKARAGFRDRRLDVAL